MNTNLLTPSKRTHKERHYECTLLEHSEENIDYQLSNKIGSHHFPQTNVFLTNNLY